MPIISTHVSSTNVAGGDVLALMAGASISSLAGAALTFSQSNVNLWLGGTVWGVTNGVQGIASGLVTGTRITVASGANVFGLDAGMFLQDTDTLVVNQGVINGGTGIEIQCQSQDSYLSIRNTGEIWADTYAIYQTYETSGHYSEVFLKNRGLISGEYGAYLGEASLSRVTIENYGTMIGNVSTGIGQDAVINRGTIEGNISTGESDDLVRLFKGLGSDYLVSAGGGDDFIDLRTTGGQYVDGGLGNDTVVYGGTRAVTVNLADQTQNAGAAAGDILNFIENLAGSNFGNDKLTGDLLANMLNGSGGNDRLAGGGGADTLMGGRGVDTLTGGIGSDAFYFAEGYLEGDAVTDFSNTGAVKDYIQFFRDLWSANLANGGLPTANFRARADNVAQDANDYFIFRTTDTTLWYDRDGNGTLYAAVMMADFAAGVVLTAADFEIL